MTLCVCDLMCVCEFSLQVPDAPKPPPSDNKLEGLAGALARALQERARACLRESRFLALLKRSKTIYGAIHTIDMGSHFGPLIVAHRRAADGGITRLQNKCG